MKRYVVFGYEAYETWGAAYSCHQLTDDLFKYKPDSKYSFYWAIDSKTGDMYEWEIDDDGDQYNWVLQGNASEFV